MVINIILLGFLGVGKGMQVCCLIENCGFVQFLIGDMLCEVCSLGIEMGKCVVEVMDCGELVMDEIVIGLICEKLV